MLLSEIILGIALLVAFASTLTETRKFHPKWYMSWASCVVGCLAAAQLIYRDLTAESPWVDWGRVLLLALTGLILLTLPTMSQKQAKDAL